MLKDERNYPEPCEFRPERFLKNGKLDESVRDPMDIAFVGKPKKNIHTLIWCSYVWIWSSAFRVLFQPQNVPIGLRDSVVWIST